MYSVVAKGNCLSKINDIVWAKGAVILNEFTRKSLLCIKCKNTHEFTISIKDVLLGKWCTSCITCRIQGNQNLMNKRQLVCYKKYSNILISRNGEMISTYNNGKTKVRVRCSSNHVTDLYVSQIKNKSWCIICKNKRYTGKYKYIRASTTKPKTNILLSKFVNTDVPLVIKCKHGHEFTNTANDMISKACPCCSDEFGTMDNEISIVENINRRGGILLSPYVSENVILCLQCEKTHTFKLSPINIRKGHWCGDCEKGK